MNILSKIRRSFNHFLDLKRQADINRLLTKAARRCSRDLRHAIDEMRDDFLRKHFQERADHWQTIFWDCGQYRDHLYSTIDKLEREVEALEKQVTELGQTPVTRPVPF